MRISFYLPPYEEELLDELAAALQVSRNKAIRVALAVAVASVRNANADDADRQRARAAPPVVT